MKRYAENTTVPAERSQAELSRMLRAHGAMKHGFLEDGGHVAVAFELEHRRVRLELIADGQSTVEREFLADIVLPNGKRVEEWLSPQLARAYEGGKMPPLLGSGS